MVANHLENLKIQDMNTKKKILVVDDTPANLDAAKAYFANNTDYEFVYATDRKGAEELLPNCDALITDRQIPYQEGEKMEDYKGYYKDKPTPDDYKIKQEANGYILLAEAVVSDMPVIMFSSHGSSTFLITLDDKNLAKEVVVKIADMDAYAIPYETVSDPMGTAITRDRDHDLPKENPESWKFVFEKLCKDFKLNEKPTEVSKIKLQ